MAPVVSTIEIARPPETVFSYVTDPERFPEWQAEVVSAHHEGTGPPAVGTRCTTTRRMGGTERTTTQEITEIDPPRSWALRGLGGPIRANVRVTVDPLADGQSSRLTIALEVEGHGVGRMIVPVIRREVAAQMPATCRRCKEHLESGA